MMKTFLMKTTKDILMTNLKTIVSGKMRNQQTKMILNHNSIILKMTARSGKNMKNLLPNNSKSPMTKMKMMTKTTPGIRKMPMTGKLLDTETEKAMTTKEETTRTSHHTKDNPEDTTSKEMKNMEREEEDNMAESHTKSLLLMEDNTGNIRRNKNNQTNKPKPRLSK